MIISIKNFKKLQLQDIFLQFDLQVFCLSTDLMSIHQFLSIFYTLPSLQNKMNWYSFHECKTNQNV